MGSPPTLGSRRFSSAQRLSSVLRAASVPRERRGAPAAATDGGPWRSELQRAWRRRVSGFRGAQAPGWARPRVSTTG